MSDRRQDKIVKFVIEDVAVPLIMSFIRGIRRSMMGSANETVYLSGAAITKALGENLSAVATFSAALIGLVGSLSVALIAITGVRAANALKRKEQDAKDQELIKSTLEFLTGGSQKRTVGIALLKNRVEDGLISSPMAEFILKGQKKHLTDSEKNNDGYRKIEIYDLKQIENLLSAWQREVEQPLP